MDGREFEGTGGIDFPVGGELEEQPASEGGPFGEPAGSVHFLSCGSVSKVSP